jgi:hypothetical protein
MSTNINLKEISLKKIEKVSTNFYSSEEGNRILCIKVGDKIYSVSKQAPFTFEFFYERPAFNTMYFLRDAMVYECNKDLVSFDENGKAYLTLENANKLVKFIDVTNEELKRTLIKNFENEYKDEYNQLFWFIDRHKPFIDVSDVSNFIEKRLGIDNQAVDFAKKEFGLSILDILTTGGLDKLKAYTIETRFGVDVGLKMKHRTKNLASYVSTDPVLIIIDNKISKTASYYNFDKLESYLGFEFKFIIRINCDKSIQKDVLHYVEELAKYFLKNNKYKVMTIDEAMSELAKAESKEKK